MSDTSATSGQQTPTEYLTRVHDGGGKTAIVFLHGFQGNATATWGDFPKHLADSNALRGWDVYTMGYNTALYPDLLRGIWSADAGLETLAGLLQTTLTVGGLASHRAVALIAHSMGGLIAQRALLEPDVRRRVSHVFLFGTPSAGLVKAWLVRMLKAQFRDMSPKSPFLKQLRERWTAEFAGAMPFHLYAVAGENDQFVPEERVLSPFPKETWHRVPGNHIQMVKPKAASDLNVRVVINGLVGNAGTSDVWNAASVAAQNLQAQDRVNKLWPDRGTLDQQALVDLALALERIGRRQDAVDVLTEHARATDGMGTLAGRLKRRWLDARRQADADRALELYDGALKLSEDAKDWPQAYYHAINVAFMQFAYKQDRTATEDNAQKALDYCARAVPSMWARATCGEAHLYLGDFDSAIEAYREAITPKPGTWVAPDTWQVTSMYDQAMEVAQRLGQEGIARRLTELFRDPAQPGAGLGQHTAAQSH